MSEQLVLVPVSDQQSRYAEARALYLEYIREAKAAGYDRAAARADAYAFITESYPEFATRGKGETEFIRRSFAASTRGMLDSVFGPLPHAKTKDKKKPKTKAKAAVRVAKQTVSGGAVPIDLALPMAEGARGGALVVTNGAGWRVARFRSVADVQGEIERATARREWQLVGALSALAAEMGDGPDGA